MLYKCVRTCFFNGRLYEKGEDADFAAGVPVPDHFAAGQQVQTETEIEKPKSKARTKKK